MPLTQQEIKSRAYAFIKEWENTSRERAEAQTFWNDFFNIFDLPRRRVATFEAPVKKLGDARGSIDLFWKGMLLVEHKSKGKDLTKAYGQALDYFPGISDQDLPQYVLVSDFTDFRLYNLDSDEEFDFTLDELPEKIHLFGFISGYKQYVYHEEDPVNIRVAEKMGELHDELLKSGYSGHTLEVFLVRLVYTLFADDTGIFQKDHFHYFLENRTNPNGFDTGSTLALIFQMLNTANEKRQSGTDEDLLEFPFVNGGLFEEVLSIPMFNEKMRKVLLDCCSFDWSKVSPAIFGSLFQTVMDKESKGKRREIGAHYTSETNILKVARPLFLDGLYTKFESIKNDRRKLTQLHEKIAALRFFDPACGCGNFLIITYRELRRLEIKILRQLHNLSGKDAIQMVLGSRIDVDSLYGIELEEFPTRIAEVAIWLTDHQMNMELSQEFGLTYIRLPLKKSANIKHGNALQLDWEFVPKANLIILGNPPFIGKQLRNAEQDIDMELTCSPLQNYDVLDYVSAWYVKAVQFIKATNIKVAFVSTNSITQGEQVGALWNWMLAQGVKIHFAHRTFRWINDARGKAAVFCVIIGFGLQDEGKKRLFDYASPDSEAMEIKAKNINPYLVDAENVIVNSRSKPISEVPEMSFGSMPNDGGYLILNDEEKKDFLKNEPAAKKFIFPLLSAKEFLHGENRWCLWLKDASPSEIKSLSEIKKKVDAVREYRLSSKREATRKLADYPYLFGEIRQPENNYVLIPRHSSENRIYIPFAFFSKESIASDSCITLPDATLYHFGVLTSRIHMAWVRAVCGRIKSDYRYSNNIVYNNFPWAMNVSEKQKERVEKSAQAVLDARKEFPDSSLADLYDPSTMPKVLVDAHRALDKAVDLCYRPEAFKTELERLEFLFGLYRQYTDPMNVAMEEKPKRKKSKMKPEEIVAEKYLRKAYGGNIVYEPRGKDTTPDFSINGVYAVEVRRLNQHFFNGEKTEGLEQLSFPLYDALKEVLASFNSQYSGKSFWVFIDYQRPLGKNMRKLKLEMRNSLEKFLQAEVPLPYTLQVNEEIKFQFYSSVPISGRVFRFGGEGDGDAGGWVISVYIDNVRHCIAEKSSKIKQYESLYREWWLYLVDYMELGLDYDDIKEVKTAISDLGQFNKVAIINYTGEFLLFDISP